MIRYIHRKILAKANSQLYSVLLYLFFNTKSRRITVVINNNTGNTIAHWLMKYSEACVFSLVNRINSEKASTIAKTLKQVLAIILLVV